VLDRVKHIHLIGIGGAGLSAIARVLLGRGYQISGSDRNPPSGLDDLKEAGVRIFEGHRAENVHGADLVLASSAVPDDNVEIQEARRLGIPVMRRREFLGLLTEGYRTIAVAGTHGKTTTTAMIAFILKEAGMSPTFIVGGEMWNLGTNAGVGEGTYFVIEADEYDHTFLGLNPYVAVVTAIEMDHPDCYPTLGDMLGAFRQFLARVSSDGLILGCGDEENVREVMSGSYEARVISYGLDGENKWRAVGVRPNRKGGNDFVVVNRDREWGPFSLGIPGLHNVKNALAAIAASYHLGVEPAQAGGILARFRGVRRRFEVKGEAGGVLVIDDYAHHPTEIKATLAAVRERYPDREIWAVFQPHTYSRTLALLEQFAASFDEAHHVIVSDIYAARERDDLGVKARDIVDIMQHPDARYIASLEEIADFLLANLRPGTVLVTLGAGDGYKVGERVLALLDSGNSRLPRKTERRQTQ